VSKIIIKLTTGEELSYVHQSSMGIKEISKAIRESGTIQINGEIVINVSHIVYAKVVE
jgi:hypothetical protein